jgi:hypothetical protein
MYWREWRNPGALERGAMLITSGGSDEQGEGRVDSASADKKDYEILQTER